MNGNEMVAKEALLKRKLVQKKGRANSLAEREIVSHLQPSQFVR